ncbi:MAG: chromosomal replication initiator protein DnaA [Planctomycetes bacterium]|nr:chromosomal replication initiator protein DnaA [Planctomycetota bacterium]
MRAHHPEVCRQWFEELEPMGIAGGAFQLRTHSAIHRDYLRRQCADAFNDAARSATGHLLSVRFLGPEDEVMRPQGRRPVVVEELPSAVTAPTPAAGVAVAAPKTQVEAPARQPMPDITQVEPKFPIGEPRVRAEPLSPAHVRAVDPSRNGDGDGRPIYVTRPEQPRRYESLVVNPDYCFENFVVGPGNRMAHAAALAIAANPGRAYNPFFVHGGVGLGKTHLLQAVCVRICEQNPKTALYYTSCEGFVTQFFESVQNGEMSEFRHRFRDVDVLVIDDIHFLAKRDSSQEEFFHTFNALFQAQKQIILSCDAPPEDIPDLEERLVSRFKWGLVTKVDQPTYETRIAILKTKAKVRGLLMPDDVACFIAEKIDTNIRELEGAVIKLHIQSTVEQRPIDMELAKEALGDSLPVPKGEPTLQAIIASVTEFYGVRLTELQSKGRQRSIALPRQVCMYLARRCTRHSLEEIGGFFGGRDHTTVMHAVETVEDKRKEDSEFDLLLRSLEEKLRAARAA